MKPSNQNTAPDHRFFVPHTEEEVLHHETFDTNGIPAVHILEGDQGYTVIQQPDGRIQGRTIDNYSLLSGDRVERVSMHSSSGSEDALPNYTTDPSLLYSRHSYEVQSGDLLILDVDNLHLRPDENNMLVWPAKAALPLSERQHLSYRLAGIINENHQLVAWSSQIRSSAARVRDIIDYCVINYQAQNALELALLEDRLRRDDSSLTKATRDYRGIAAYLRAFDALHGTAYMPTQNPSERRSRFAAMTPAQITLYNDLAMVARSQLEDL